MGDGRKLSPIDYMVWKDHVNVLDQWRIFRLLAKGPRLDGYLAQLKTADKLDFASWGGFAQNFAGRRIPVRERRLFGLLEPRRRREPAHSHVRRGRFGPVSARRRHQGRPAHRHGVRQLARRHAARTCLARVKGERLPRRPAEAVEEQALGPAGLNRMRFVGAGDSATVPTTQFKVYLLRTSTLLPRGGGFALGWKQSPRGAVDGARPEDSTPLFAEMAVPGSAFEGDWDEKTFFLQPEMRRALRWPESFNRAKIFDAVNVYAAGLLALQRQYASWAGMGLLDQSLEELEQRLAAAREKRVVPALAGLGRRPAPPRAPGSTPPTRITARSWTSSRSTTARWRPTCRSRKPARSCS